MWKVKISKFRLAVLVMLVITTIYAGTLVLSIQAYQSWKEEKLLQYPEPVRPYVDLEPFLVSSYGILYLPFSIILVFAWVGLLASLNLKKRKKILIGTILPVCIGCTLIFPVAYATPETVQMRSVWQMKKH